MKLLTIGGATQDIFFTTDDQQLKRLSSDHEQYLMIPEGAKLIMDDAYIATGGGATNAAATFTKLGHEADVCSITGNDSTREFIIDNLRQHDIGCQYITTTEHAHTAISCIILSPTGNRTIFVYRGANVHFTPDHLPNNLSPYDGIYITSLAQQSAQHSTTITERAHTGGPVAHNPGREELETYTETLCHALSYIDMFIVNAREARQLLAYFSHDAECVRRLLSQASPHAKNDSPELLTHFDTVEETCIDVRTYMREIMRRGPNVVVVTNGSEGVYVGHKDTLYFGKAPSVDVRCSVGAGDACGSTLFAYYVMEASLPQALARAIANSCSVLQTPDAKQGHLSHTELSNTSLDNIHEYPLIP